MPPFPSAPACPPAPDGAPAAEEANPHALLLQVEELIARDQRRKALLAIPLALGVGAAVAAQATWVLALAGTGLLLAQLPQRRRS